jgi:hypothetical protein
LYTYYGIDNAHEQKYPFLGDMRYKIIPSFYLIIMILLD